ncbi:MAG TPA: type II secretion system protein GspG [Candidatus Hydrogenedentes bacterium]|nr:type II secretion system protein GspG [Candidatus Hydrogenedentota bacterium]HOT49687.1 type II secretion system protein GspG [Candidatus Hydrogenedentota bacterium]HOV75050.1 type II secretion system protein GspG [Candidatus Hydrogenedentota bacterium]HPC15213.1 type II secretion system protein GspG [Candidatus Hydrogenedentota bacterium]HRT19532.1 type II secretion system protein GspG [Candidatus Hydrogenedentota bacterium]
MSDKGGFTLIELILVTVIIGILAGMVTLTFAGRAEEARRRAAKGDIASYGTAIDLYALDHNDKYPSSLQDLASGKRKYVKELNKDPWGNDYVYKVSGGSYTVSSAGPDGQPGTEDDVTLTSADSVDTDTGGAAP